LKMAERRDLHAGRGRYFNFFFEMFLRRMQGCFFVAQKNAFLFPLSKMTFQSSLKYTQLPRYFSTDPQKSLYGRQMDDESKMTFQSSFKYPQLPRCFSTDPQKSVYERKMDNESFDENQTDFDENQTDFDQNLTDFDESAQLQDSVDVEKSPEESSSRYSEMGYTTGVVKWFDSSKGYGFIIRHDNNEDIFVHFTAIQGSGYRTLEEGQRVQFSIQEGHKGDVAEDVTIEMSDF